MSVAPAILHLNGAQRQAAPIRRGDTYSHTFSFVDAAGTPIDKSTSTFLAQIRPTPDGTVTETFAVTVGGTGSNVVTVALTAEETAMLTPGVYVWDLQETAGGVTVTRLAGKVTVTADVSRP